jgi:hypothetical protein
MTWTGPALGGVREVVAQSAETAVAATARQATAIRLLIVDPDTPCFIVLRLIDNQLAFLKRVTKLSEEQLGVLLQKLGQPSEGEKKEIKPTPRWQYPAQQMQFHILDHLQVRRKTGRNWITRCPSCASAGRDKSGDNLAISVDEPQKYICWAGCSKEMIRAALG